jgi:catechol 2,3-dioxygenase-like lactoylglutathione lyase family enzyme
MTLNSINQGEQDMSRAIPKQISVASLWTDDVPTTVRFYGDVIGLRLCLCQTRHMDPPHFDVGGAYLAIVKGKTVLAPNAETFPQIALAVDDLDSAIAGLKTHHVDLLKGVQEDPDSRWVFFRDPGGNLIELVHWN